MTVSKSALSETAFSSNSTRALCVAKLTLALNTPASLPRTRSLRAAQEAQCMPPMLKVAVFIAGFLTVRIRNDGDCRPRRHHPHAAVERELTGLGGGEADGGGAIGGQ